MPGFEFEFAVVLGASLLVSFCVFLLTWPKEGQIKLPTYRHFAEDDEDSPELEGVRDPFDITNPADMTDGFTIGEENFWKKVRFGEILCSVWIADKILDASPEGLFGCGGCTYFNHRINHIGMGHYF